MPTYIVSSMENPNNEIQNLRGGASLDYSEVMDKKFEELALLEIETHNAAYQYALFACYDEGRGVEKSAEMAFKWLFEANKNANLETFKNFPIKTHLGWCYEDGLGVGKNLKKAVELYESASDLGCDAAVANRLLYSLYARREIPFDDDDEFQRRFNAASNGCASAQFYVSVCYFFGIVEDIDHKASLDWLKQAAESGFPQAQYNLAMVYDRGRLMRRSTELAFKWHLRAAKQGFAPAMYRVGLCYQYGIGVKPNNDKAIDWMHKASQVNFAPAAYKMGDYWLNGIGVRPDLSCALLYYEDAAEFEITAEKAERTIKKLIATHSLPLQLLMPESPKEIDNVSVLLKKNETPYICYMTNTLDLLCKKIRQTHAEYNCLPLEYNDFVANPRLADEFIEKMESLHMFWACLVDEEGDLVIHLYLAGSIPFSAAFGKPKK